MDPFAGRFWSFEGMREIKNTKNPQTGEKTPPPPLEKNRRKVKLKKTQENSRSFQAL